MNNVDNLISEAVKTLKNNIKNDGLIKTAVVKGGWIWINGYHKKHSKILRSLGYTYSHTKNAWYLIAEQKSDKKAKGIYKKVDQIPLESHSVADY